MAKKLRDFFREMRLHPLVAWTRYFDINNDRKIDADEFRLGMTCLEYPGDIDIIFQEIDADGSGYITMNEIDHVSTDLWNSFREWCGQAFGSAEEMEAQLTNCVFSQGLFHVHAGVKLSKEEISTRKATLVALGGFTKKQFIENSVRLGWYGEYEQVLYKAMDRRRVGRVSAKDIIWFEKERWRALRLNANKTKGVSSALSKKELSPAMLAVHSQMQSKVQAGRALRAFLTYLRRRFGCLFRAWRCLLDSDGSMCVSRKEFFKSCRSLGWNGDVAALWRALDWDDSGSTQLQELAPNEARTLALFKVWCDKKYGSAKSTLYALNHSRSTKWKLSKAGRLSKEQFIQACHTVGCPYDPFDIVELLDWEMDGNINANDMKCLDQWKVTAEWLTGEPDQVAAHSFIEMLMLRYRHAVKAWCRALDRCSSGRATFADFKWGVEHIGFKGNYVGAWLALDADSSGYITLREVDQPAACVLAQFRCWAHDAFGSVVLAIEALDVDSSGALSLREFRRGLRENGYKGDAPDLFFSLDCDSSGELSASEVAFLDEWELAEILELTEEFPHDEFEDEEEEEEPEIKSYFEARRIDKKQKRQKPRGPWPRLNMVAKPTLPRGGNLKFYGAFFEPTPVKRKQAVHESVLAELGYDVKSVSRDRTPTPVKRKQAGLQSRDRTPTPVNSISHGQTTISPGGKRCSDLSAEGAPTAFSLLHLVGCYPKDTHMLRDRTPLPGQPSAELQGQEDIARDIKGESRRLQQEEFPEDVKQDEGCWRSDLVKLGQRRAEERKLMQVQEDNRTSSRRCSGDALLTNLKAASRQNAWGNVMQFDSDPQSRGNTAQDVKEQSKRLQQEVFPEDVNEDKTNSRRCSGDALLTHLKTQSKKLAWGNAMESDNNIVSSMMLNAA